MALPATITSTQLLGNVTADLLDLRNALTRLKERYRWTSSVALSDIEGLGIDPTTAQDLLTAVADANGLAAMYDTGQALSTYPQVTGTPYPYGNSQRAFLGPQ